MDRQADNLRQILLSERGDDDDGGDIRSACVGDTDNTRTHFKQF